MLVQLPPPSHGAAEMNKLAISALRDVTNYDIHVIDISPPQSIGRVGRLAINKVLYSFRVWSALIACVLRVRPETCYFAIPVRGYAFYRELVTLFLLRIFGVRRVFHLHAQGVRASIVKHDWRRSLYEFAFRDAEVIVTSPRLIEDVRAVVPDTHVHVVPNGIPDPTSVTSGWPGDRSGEPIRAEEPVLLFLSNMFESKGPLVLLEAAAILKERGCRFRLQMAGAWVPPLTQTFMTERLRELGLAAQVSLLGAVAGEAKAAAFRASNIFVHPTYDEAFPLVLLEAMAFSLPVVSTSVGGIPDIVLPRETGFLVAERDPLALARTLQYLIEDRDACLRMGRNGRQRFEALFTEAAFRYSLQNTVSRLLQ